MTGLVTHCRSCQGDIVPVLSLGLLPLANQYVETPRPLEFCPHELMRCPTCGLAQLGFTAPSEEVFDAGYPCSSSTTRALRENFADLAAEAGELIGLSPEDLVIDIGGNDGNLLSNFVGKRRVLNVTPEDIGALGVERGIPHLQQYWSRETAADVLAQHGKAKLVTATNVFAHVPDPHEFIEAVLSVLTDDGVFLSESHYLGALLRDVQYDTVYSEHARYLSLTSIANMLRQHGLVVAFARAIDSHGGSIRVYACKSDMALKIAAGSEKFRGRAMY